MEETKACLGAFILDGQGGGLTSDLPAVAAEQTRLTWIHLNGRHADTRKFLKEKIDLSPALIKSLLAEETRPRLEETAHGALVVLRGIHFNPGPAPEDLVSIRLWVTQNRIISVGRRKARAIADIEQRIHDKRGPRTAGEFISILCGALNDGIEPAVQEIEDTLDRLEDVALENPDARLRGDLAAIRKETSLFRRHLNPQRDVVARLAQTSHGWLLPPEKWFMQDNIDRLTRITEDIETIQQRALILQDEIYSALSARVNKNLYVLSVISVIFMPLTFISGLLGMNVAGIPGADSPYAFAVVCAIAGGIAILQILLFRGLKWL